MNAHEAAGDAAGAAAGPPAGLTNAASPGLKVSPGAEGNRRQMAGVDRFWRTGGARRHIRVVPGDELEIRAPVGSGRREFKVQALSRVHPSGGLEREPGQRTSGAPRQMFHW